MPAMLSMVQICCPGAFLGVEFPSAGLDAGGSEQNHPNQNRCKEFAAWLQPGKAACSTLSALPHFASADAADEMGFGSEED